MKWEEVRHAFPEQWVLIEVVQAHTNEHSERILDDMDPLKKFSNSPEAMKICQEIHRYDLGREVYVLHTSRKEPHIMQKKEGIGR